MIGIVATLTIQDGKHAAFEAAFKDLAAQVKANEPGCLVYQLTKSRTEPNTYKVLELYASEEAAKHHGGSAHFKAGGALLAPSLAGRPEIEYLDAVV
jgi:quinol monooxygenase YgiN